MLSHVFTILAAIMSVVAQVTGELGDAMEVMDNPPGARYIAMFEESEMSPVMGEVVAMSDESGTSINFEIMLMGLPEDGGPYSYHLHAAPVPEDGNCTETMAHLDPYMRGQDPPCDVEMPQTCEVGDLAGKYGKVDGPEVSKSFMDKYAALEPSNNAYFGDLSIVIHFSNSTRLACANFMKRDMTMEVSSGASK